MKTWLRLLIFLCLSSSAVASDVTTQQSILYPYKSSIIFQDDFLSGNTTSGAIGSLGWGFTNGSVTILASETNRPGIMRRSTSAVSGTVTATRLNINTSTMFVGNLNHDLMWMARLNTNDANTTVRLGVGNPAFGVAPPDHGIYFEKLDGDTNWFCITRSSAVETRTDSGIAVNTSFNTFAYFNMNGSVAFQLNNATVCTHTTNIPTVVIMPWTHIINSAAADKTLDHDYFQLRLYGLVR